MDNSFQQEIISIDKEIQRLTTNELLSQKELCQNWFILQQKAKKFLLIYNTDINAQWARNYINKRIKNIQISLKNDKTISLADLYKNIIQDRNEALLVRQAVFMAAFEFDEALTAYRKQVPKKAIYTANTKLSKSIKSFEMSFEELALNITIDNRISAPLKQHRINLEKDEQKSLNQEHINKITQAINGTYNRLEVYYRQAKNLSANKEKFQKQNGLLLYKTSRYWTKFRVLNYGDVKEAYISALFIEHQSNLDKLCKEPSGDPPFYSHSLIKTFAEDYIHKVTNQAAIVEEDVITQLLQYGVKSQGAEAPSLKQYATAAQIVLSQNFLTRPKIEKLIRENYPQNTSRNIIANSLTEEEEIVVNKIIPKLRKNINLTL